LAYNNNQQMMILYAWYETHEIYSMTDQHTLINQLTKGWTLST